MIVYGSFTGMIPNPQLIVQDFPPSAWRVHPPLAGLNPHSVSAATIPMGPSGSLYKFQINVIRSKAKGDFNPR